MSRTYTAVVVGAGMAGHLAMRALTDSPRFKPVAVADLRGDALEAMRREYGAKLQTFASPAEMLEACRPDVACIATYAPSHLPLTRGALACSSLKGIVVEKPLGDTAAAGRDVLDAVKARGIPMAVPHGLLVAPHAAEILRRVHAGEIGPLRLVEIRNDKWDIINAGIHWLNFFVALTRNEPIDWVMAACDTSTRTYRDGMQVETLGVTYACTRSGVRVIMNTGDAVNTGIAGKGAVFHIVGAHGIIEFHGWDSQYRIVNREFPGGTTIDVAPGTATNHQRHLENLAAQMDAREANDYRVAESSLIALEIVEAAYASHRHRCQVKLPLATFQPPAISDWDPGRPYSGTGGGRDGRTLG